MRVFVLGGTGAIGRHAVPALVAADHTVTALARTEIKATALRAEGAEPVNVSMFDRDALVGAFAHHDAVVNLATAMPSTSRFMLKSAHAGNRKVRIEGAAAVAGAAADAGVGRLVQESVSMIYADGGDRWLDEAAPVDRYWLAEPNMAAEASAHGFADGGRRATVLRFGLFYGPGAAHAEEALAAARRHFSLQLGPANSYLSSIHMTDAASAVVAALEAPGDVYNVVDDEPLTWGEYTAALAAAARTRPWLRGPGRVSLLFGDRLTSLSRSLRVSNRRLREETGWAPRYPSAREGWLATASALAGSE